MTRDMTKGARFSYYIMLFGMGCSFWIATVTGHFTMYAPVYGKAANFPAEAWAAALMFPSAVYLMALFINGRRWWTSPLRCFIGFFTIFHFALFVFSSFGQEGGGVMFIPSGVLMMKAGVMLAFDIADFRRKRHDRE